MFIIMDFVETATNVAARPPRGKVSSEHSLRPPSSSYWVQRQLEPFNDFSIMQSLHTTPFPFSEVIRGFYCLYEIHNYLHSQYIFCTTSSSTVCTFVSIISNFLVTTKCFFGTSIKKIVLEARRKSFLRLRRTTSTLHGAKNFYNKAYEIILLMRTLKTKWWRQILSLTYDRFFA